MSRIPCDRSERSNASHRMKYLLHVKNRKYIFKLNNVDLWEGVNFPVGYYVEFSNCLKKKKKKKREREKKKTKLSNLLSLPSLLCPFNTSVYFVATLEQICMVTEQVVLTQT